MYELIYVTEFLLQSSFRNPIEFYYTRKLIFILCMMYDDWALYQELFTYLCTLTWSTFNGII
jgi:hypothetical protein